VAGVVGSIATLFGLPSGYPGGDAYGLMQVNPKVVHSFTSTDTRGNHGSIMIQPYLDPNHSPAVTWSVPSPPQGISDPTYSAAFAKYLDETDKQNETARSWEQQGNAWIILRYADVLLMYAEAVNQGGTPTAMSRDQALDMVRKRGDPSAPTLGGLSQAAFQDTIIVERDKEFLYEGQRWFDLARWNVLDSVFTAKTTLISQLYPGETTPHGVPNNLFPIPLTEIQVNPKLTQNPGW
jgi:hypothetical protein